MTNTQIVLLTITVVIIFTFVLLSVNTYAQTSDCINDNSWIFYQLDYTIRCLEERIVLLENNQNIIETSNKIELEKRVDTTIPNTKDECIIYGYDIVEMQNTDNKQITYTCQKDNILVEIE